MTEPHTVTIDANEGVYIGEEGSPDEIIIEWGEFRLTLVKGNANASDATWVAPEILIFAEALVERDGYNDKQLSVGSCLTNRGTCGTVKLYGF